jgi:hypothetical protein
MVAHYGLVLHVQQGNGSLYGYFNNPASQVSSHFWCAKDGTLEQYVDTDVQAWAEAAGNPFYLSVETEGSDTEDLTIAQLGKVAELLSWAAGEYGFGVTGPVAHGSKGLTPHCNPDGTPDPAWGNHTCPGTIRLAQMPTIVALAQPTPPPIKPEEIMQTFENSKGQTVIVGNQQSNGHTIVVTSGADAKVNGGWSLADVTGSIEAAYPGTVVVVE